MFANAFQAFLIPFEISALNLAITFWSDKVPIPAISCGCILIYGFVVVQLFIVF